MFFRLQHRELLLLSPLLPGRPAEAGWQDRMAVSSQAAFFSEKISALKMVVHPKPMGLSALDMGRAGEYTV